MMIKPWAQLPKQKLSLHLSNESSASVQLHQQRTWS